MPAGHGAGGSGTPGHRRVWISVDVDVFYRSDTALFYGVDWGRGVQVSSNADPATVTNASIVYVNGLGGGQVRLLEETYDMNDPLLMADEVLLSGQGKSSSTFLNGDGLADGEHLIVISGDTNCGIRDLQLQTEDGGGKTSHCIFIEDGSNNFYIENVVIVDSDSDGIHIEGTNILGGHIHNCGILDVDNIGISVNMDAANYMDYFHVNNSVITDCGQNGLSLADCRYSEVSGNIIDQNGQDGIELNLTVDTLVQNNIIYLNTQHGISLVNADRNTVEGNLCHSNDSGNTATYDGINVDGDSTENLIEGNYSYLNKRYGVMTSGLRTVIQGNYVWGNDRHGIYEDVTDCSINDNFCYDNGQDAAGTYHGIYVGGARTEVIGNFCTDPGDSTEDGIFLASGADQCNVSDNFCYNLMGDGVELNTDDEYCVVSDNVCSSNDDHGVVLSADSCEYNIISGNYCLSNGLDGIDVAGEENIINNNNCYGNSQTAAGTSHGIILQAGADRCIVNGNFCNSRGSDQEDGIHLADGADQCVISDNFCYNGMGDGIELVANNNYCLLEGNHCHSNDDFGIVLTGTTSTQNSIQDNYIYYNGSSGISVNSPETAINDNYVYDNSRTQAAAFHGIHLANTAADRCMIDGNYVIGDGTNQEDGINLIDGASNASITNNHIYDNAGEGIELNANNDNCHIEGNYIDSNDDNGILIAASTCQINSVVGNYINNCGLNGISNAGPDTQINDNFIYLCGWGSVGTYHGIHLADEGADRCQICDNIVSDGGARTEDGIHLVDGVCDCHITGNYIRNMMGDGIDLVANNNDNHIEDNYLAVNDDYGVRIRAATCTANFVKNNHYNGNITGAISDGGTDTALHEYFAEITDPDAMKGPHPVINLPDATNTNWRLQWLAPRDFQELVRAQGIYVCDSTGNMDFWDYAQFGKICVEAWDMHYASTTETTQTFDYSGSFECIDHSGALVGIAAGDLAGIRIGRGGANAGDTINDRCYFFGLKIEYV